MHALKKSRRIWRIYALTGILATIVALVGGIAWATIPDGNTINGCYGKVGGVLRVIDTAKNQKCSTALEVPISWNQKGQPGQPGEQGLRGEQGEQGPPGVVPDQTCPSGQYVTGVVGGVLQCGPNGPTTTKQSFDIAIVCTSPLTQVCNPPYTATVSAQSAATLNIRYTTGPLTCSLAKHHVSLDGVLVFTSQLLNTLEPTGWVSLGQVTAGQHAIAIQPEGVISGCNTGGYIAAWEGTLETELVAG